LPLPSGGLVTRKVIVTILDSPNGQTSQICVLILNITGDLCDRLVQLIQRQADMVLVSNLAQSGALPRTVGGDIDVVIIGAAYLYPPPDFCSLLWSSFPLAKVLVLLPDGEAGMFYWLNVQQHRLDTVSAQSVIHNIRRVHRLGLTVD
jgi:hypothetical protein